MIKHIVMWQFKDELDDNKKESIINEIRNSLVELKEIISGTINIELISNPLSTSNVDIMLDSTFKDIDALKNYGNHPNHTKIKDEKIVPNVKSRYCIDYEI